MHADPAAAAAQNKTKRARRPRQPAPRRRTPLASVRRFNGLVIQFARDLGGLKNLSIAEAEQVRAAAALVLRSEQLAAAVVAGELVDTGELVRLSSEARRALAALRKRAVPAKQGPTLGEYLARIASEEAAKRPSSGTAA